MLYHNYGDTGVKVSAVGFGGMRFKDQNNVEQCASLVKYAYDSGITYFDTAPGYGKSEDLFGTAFKEMLKTRNEKPFYVSTKSNKADPDDLRRDLENSLSRMGLDYIDFFHMWCIITLDEYRERKAKGVLQELEKFKQEGLIRHICVSTHLSGENVEALLKDYPFDGVLLGYSAMNFAYRDEGLDAAANLNRGVVVMNPLGGGLIPDNPDRFGFVKTREDETIVEGALRFLFNDSRIDIALVGFSERKHVDQACSAAEGFAPISKDKVDAIRTNLNDSFDHLCTSCGYCDNCPQEIPIPKLMDVYNHYILTGKEKQLITRLKYHWGIELDDDILRDCIRCGQCEAECTQQLPICDRLDEIEEIADRELAKAKRK
jgi:hypothetical protein